MYCLAKLQHVNMSVDENGNTPLQVYLESLSRFDDKESTAKLAVALIKGGAALDHVNNKGYTAITIAALANLRHVVKELKSQGANLDLPATGKGVTPLMAACMACNVELVQMLVGAGANVNIVLAGGVTALNLCCTRKASGANIACLKILYLAGVVVNNGVPAICVAKQYGNGDAAAFLKFVIANRHLRVVGGKLISRKTLVALYGNGRRFKAIKSKVLLAQQRQDDTNPSDQTVSCCLIN